MLAYAASRRTTAQRRPSPQAMLAIAVAHVAVIAAVMSARMDLPEKLKPRPTEVDLIRLPPPPPPPEPQPRAEPRPAPSAIDIPPVIQPIPQPRLPVDVQPVPVPLTPGPVIGSAVPRPLPEPGIAPQPRPAPPVRTGPRFATPDHALRPPYPPSKIDSGEEASLRLRLTIDERGRVTSVEPVGAADRAFLAAARRHLIAKWRYRPATEDGRAVASSTIITLRFELE